MGQKHTSTETFMPGGITAFAPNGNEVYLNDAIKYKLRFRQLQPIVWDVYSQSGTGKTTPVRFPAGTVTFPVSNIFYSKSKGVVLIEVDDPDGKYTMRTALTKKNFDLSPLDTLPNAATVKSEAQQRSRDANEAIDMENMDWPSKILASILGVNFKRNAVLLAAAIAGIFYLKNRR